MCAAYFTHPNWIQQKFDPKSNGNKSGSTTIHSLPGNMIDVEDLDPDQPSRQMPEKPLKEWRREFEAGALHNSSLMQFFQNASPYFFTIEQVPDSNDLGKCSY